jgi:hypothetical protein
VSPPPPRPSGPPSLDRAFDEARFGPARTLNLRAGLPTADAAVRRADAWLRQLQTTLPKAFDERDVLVITGRGAGSVGGVAVIREAILAHFPIARRNGIILSWQEHSSGSFVVRVAPIRYLVEARQRASRPVVPPGAPRHETGVLHGLDPATRDQLRLLSHAALTSLGVKLITESMLGDEMVRQFSRLAAAIPEGADREGQLATAIREALDEVER